MLKLLQTKLNKRNQDEGFTLIELLVVIAIIGILAAIALPVFLNQQVEATKATIKSDTHNTTTSAASYLAENPTATTLPDSIKVSTNGNTVTVSGSGAAYNICVSNPTIANYSFGYDATTGHFSEGCTTGSGGNGTPPTNIPTTETVTTPTACTATLGTVEYTQKITTIANGYETTYRYTPGTYNVGANIITVATNGLTTIDAAAFTPDLTNFFSVGIDSLCDTLATSEYGNDGIYTSYYGQDWGTDLAWDISRVGHNGSGVKTVTNLNYNFTNTALTLNDSGYVWVALVGADGEYQKGAVIGTYTSVPKV